MEHYEPDVAETKNPRTTFSAEGPPTQLLALLETPPVPKGRRFGRLLILVGIVGLVGVLGYGGAIDDSRIVFLGIVPLALVGFGLAFSLERASGRDPNRQAAIAEILRAVSPIASHAAVRADLGWYGALFPLLPLTEPGHYREGARWGVVLALRPDGRRMSFALRVECRRSKDLVLHRVRTEDGRTKEEKEYYVSDRIQDFLEVRVDGPLRGDADAAFAEAQRPGFRIERADWQDAGVAVEFKGDPWARNMRGNVWETKEDAGRLDGEKAAAVARAAVEVAGWTTCHS